MDTQETQSPRRSRSPQRPKSPSPKRSKSRSRSKSPSKDNDSAKSLEPETDILNFEDFVLSPEELQDRPILRKAVTKKEYEIDIEPEDEEILIRDLQNSPYAYMSDFLVKFAFDYDPDKVIDVFYKNYVLHQDYHLPWVVPIVRDEKLVYKRKQQRVRSSDDPDEMVDDRTAVLKDAAQLAEIQKQLFQLDQVIYSQNLVNLLHNYPSIPPINVRNHSGRPVLRLRGTKDPETDLITPDDLEFRGSYGDWKITRLIERATKRKLVVTDFEVEDRVLGEPLNVIGFALFPTNFPSPKLSADWRANVRIELGTDLNKILRGYFPTPNQLVDRYATTRVTDIRAFIRLFQTYGHHIGAAGLSVRQRIQQIILTNLDLIRPETYTPKLRLEFPYLDRILAETPLFSNRILTDPALTDYGINFTQITGISHRFFKVMNQLDNGQIWLQLLWNQLYGITGKNPENVRKAVLNWRIKTDYLQRVEDLRNSYFNKWAETPDDPSLLESAENPLDSIQELRPDKRRRIAWVHYFKNARLGKNEKFYYYRGRWLGCQHEYDDLYKEFENPDDSFPMGKRYTQVIPGGGIICTYCGDTIVDPDDLIEAGYDERGQKVLSYTELTRREYPDLAGRWEMESSMVLFEKNKNDVHLFGEKIIDRWLSTTQQPFNPSHIRFMKYAVLTKYDELVNNNYFEIGLRQNPNLSINDSFQFNEFAKFLVDQYKIEKAGTPVNRFFIQRITSPFTSLLSVYDLVIQRLAVLLICFNWYLVTKFDPTFINPVILLDTFTQEELGGIFYELQLKKKKLVRDTGAFYSVFGKEYRTAFRKPKMSELEVDRAMAQTYKEYEKRFLYVANQVGQIFNGMFPFEYEFVRVIDEYREQSTTDNLRQLYLKYWKRWTDDHQNEVTLYEKQLRTSSIKESQILGHVDPDNRPLYDRSIAQQKFLIRRQLHQLNLALVNDHVYQLQDRRIKGTARVIESYQELLQKKFFYLNRLDCEDWSELDELDIVGIDLETERINQIHELRLRLSELNLPPKLYRPPTFFGLSPDVQPRSYQIYPTKLVPVDRTNGGKVKVEMKSLKITVPTRKPPNLDLDRFEERAELYRPLDFLPKIRDILENLGQLTYLDELNRLNHKWLQITNAQFAGVDKCNQEATVETEEFAQNFKTVKIGPSANTKNKMHTLKNYITTNLRQRIELLSRIQNEDQMNDHHLFSYVRLIEIAENFNEAFVDFQPTLSNKAIDDLVMSHLSKPETHEQVIRVLEYVFLNDIVQHLRQVRIKSGQHKTGKSRRQGEKGLRDVFVAFLRIMVSEIQFQEKANQTPLLHKEINQIFTHKMYLDKTEAAKKKGVLEREIMKYQLNIAEDEEEEEDVGGPDLDDHAVTVKEEHGGEWEELDVENDEDDIDDYDMTYV